MAHYHVLTDQQLNEAVVITRSTPGPVGRYVVRVRYFADGVPGCGRLVTESAESRPDNMERTGGAGVRQRLPHLASET